MATNFTWLNLLEFVVRILKNILLQKNRIKVLEMKTDIQSGIEGIPTATIIGVLSGFTLRLTEVHFVREHYMEHTVVYQIIFPNLRSDVWKFHTAALSKKEFTQI
jgi:hypothetical protein